MTNFQINQSFSNSAQVPAELFNQKTFYQAKENLKSVPGYSPTVLIDFPQLAKRLQIANLSCKYEGARLGGGSFKPLGISSAVIEIAKREILRRFGFQLENLDLFTGKYREQLNSLTLTSATSGNHGFALAWIANLIGSKSRIYCPADMSENRKKRIAEFGGEVITVHGSFDEAVRLCSKESSEFDYIVVSNLIQKGLEDIPQLIMNGYALLADEIYTESKKPISHIFVGGGGGRLAAATAAFFATFSQAEMPKIVVVEPEASDCIYRSLEQGEIMSSSSESNSVMTGLVVKSPSAVAWPILKEKAFAAMTISDEVALEHLSKINLGQFGDDPLPVGETGIAAFAGLLQATTDANLRKDLGIDSNSYLVAIACEGITDQQLLDSLMVQSSVIK